MTVKTQYGVINSNNLFSSINGYVEPPTDSNSNTIAYDMDEEGTDNIGPTWSVNVKMDDSNVPDEGPLVDLGRLSSLRSNPFMKSCGMKKRTDVRNLLPDDSLMNSNHNVPPSVNHVGSVHSEDSDEAQEYHPGSGFVHKLLDKFALLSTKDEHSHFVNHLNKVNENSIGPRRSSSVENMLGNDSADNIHIGRAERSQHATAYTGMRAESGHFVSTIPLQSSMVGKIGSVENLLSGQSFQPLASSNNDNVFSHSSVLSQWQKSHGRAPNINLGRDDIIIIEKTPSVRRYSGEHRLGTQRSSSSENIFSDDEYPKPNTVASCRSLFESSAPVSSTGTKKPPIKAKPRIGSSSSFSASHSKPKQKVQCHTGSSNVGTILNAKALESQCSIESEQVLNDSFGSMNGHDESFEHFNPVYDAVRASLRHVTPKNERTNLEQISYSWKSQDKEGSGSSSESLVARVSPPKVNFDPLNSYTHVTHTAPDVSKSETITSEPLISSSLIDQPSNLSTSKYPAQSKGSVSTDVITTSSLAQSSQGITANHNTVIVRSEPDIIDKSYSKANSTASNDVKLKSSKDPIVTVTCTDIKSAPSQKNDTTATQSRPKTELLSSNASSDITKSGLNSHIHVVHSPAPSQFLSTSEKTGTHEDLSIPLKADTAKVAKVNGLTDISQVSPDSFDEKPRPIPVSRDEKQITAPVINERKPTGAANKTTRPVPATRSVDSAKLVSLKDTRKESTPVSTKEVKGKPTVVSVHSDKDKQSDTNLTYTRLSKPGFVLPPNVTIPLAESNRNRFVDKKQDGMIDVGRSWHYAAGSFQANREPIKKRKRQAPHPPISDLNLSGGNSIPITNLDSEGGLVPALDLSGLMNNDDEWEYQEGYIPQKIAPCQYTFAGDNVLMGRSMLNKNKTKKMKLTFNDKATETYEYPCEELLLDEYLASHPEILILGGEGAGESSDDIADMPYMDANEDSPEDNAGSGSAILRSSPALMDEGGLSSYKSRFQEDYHFGMELERQAMRDYEAQEQLERELEELEAAAEDGDIHLRPATDDSLYGFSGTAQASDMLF